MVNLFGRIFGKKTSSTIEEKTQEVPKTICPAPALTIARRTPDAVSSIPLADIKLTVSPSVSPSWLDYHLDTAVFSPPIDPFEYDTYTVVDVETTGLDPVSGEILEVSALRFEHFQPVQLFTALVKPEKFKSVPTAAAEVNKITDEDISKAVPFRRLRESLQTFIDEAPIIVGHNLPFDVQFLYRAGIVFSPEKCYVDTCYNSSHYLGYKGLFSPPRLTSHKLTDLCAFFNIPFDDAHFSASDCLATGLVYQALLEDMAKYVPPKPDYSPAEYIPVKEFVPRCEVDPNSPVFGKKIVFTGELSLDRREAMQLAVDAGMKLMNSVTKKTNYLVRGTYLNPDYQSGKYKKALALNESGEGHVEIIDEATFTSLIAKRLEVSDTAPSACL